jgi:cell division septation protein DedD
MELEDQGRVPAVAEVPPTVSRGASHPGDARSPSASPNAPPVAAPPAPQLDMPTPPAPPSQVIPLSPAPASSPSGSVGAQPSPPDSGPQLTARIGPLGDGDDAERLAAQFQREGFVARVATETSESPRRYVVVSEPTSRQMADARARSLATLGIKTSIVQLDGGLVRLLFGASPEADEARLLARQIRARGYPAIVVPEGGTLYFVAIGPHGKAKMDELVGRLSTGTLPVMVTPAP